MIVMQMVSHNPEDSTILWLFSYAKKQHKQELSGRI